MRNAEEMWYYTALPHYITTLQYNTLILLWGSIYILILILLQISNQYLNHNTREEENKAE